MIDFKQIGEAALTAYHESHENNFEWQKWTAAGRAAVAAMIPELAQGRYCRADCPFRGNCQWQEEIFGGSAPGPSCPAHGKAVRP